MTKAVLNKLKKIAADLPKIYEKTTVVAPYNEVKKHYVKASRKVNYTKVEMKLVNHVTKLKTAYKGGGDAAVQKYSADTYRILSEQNKTKPKEVRTL